jgi:hypothetical protein
MCNLESKVPEQNATAKATAPDGITARGKDGCGAVLSCAIGSKATIHVGDAKKVIEKYFRKRAVAAPAVRAESAAGARYPVFYSLLREKLCDCEI